MERMSLRYTAFFFSGLLYSILCTWVELPYLLPGNLILFEIIIIRKIKPWLIRKGLGLSFLKKLEWTFLVITALFSAMVIKVLFVEAYKIPSPSMEKTLLTGDYILVSKLTYGPRMPQTPMALPFFHNRLPSGRKSWSDRIQLPYNRLRGLKKIERGDIIVFNFPEGDTVLIEHPELNYYVEHRKKGGGKTGAGSKTMYYEVDRRENYIKRCVALPGDTLEIEEGFVRVNGEAVEILPLQQKSYYVHMNKSDRLPVFMDSLINAKSLISHNPDMHLCVLQMTEQEINRLKKNPLVKQVRNYTEPLLSFEQMESFPHHSYYRWSADEFGPLVIPAKGDSITLNKKNLPLYQRIIETYEGNTLELNDDTIRVNGSITNSYFFRMDYYFVMGDNQHNSTDSRYWGFVPEDHLLGKAFLVWFSTNPELGFIGGFRKERIFRRIK